MTRRQPNHLAEKLLVGLAENIGGQHGELIRAVRVVQAFQDGL